MAINPEYDERTAAESGQAKAPQLRVVQDRIQIEFLIEDLAKQLIINRGPLVANGCNGCNSCS